MQPPVILAKHIAENYEQAGRDPHRAPGYAATMMPRALILIGVVFVVAGLLWPLLARIGFGRLPGDIAVQRDGFTFYLPIISCLIVSVVLSVILWLFRR